MSALSKEIPLETKEKALHILFQIKNSIQLGTFPLYQEDFFSQINSNPILQTNEDLITYLNQLLSNTSQFNKSNSSFHKTKSFLTSSFRETSQLITYEISQVVLLKELNLDYNYNDDLEGYQITDMNIPIKITPSFLNVLVELNRTFQNDMTSSLKILILIYIMCETYYRETFNHNVDNINSNIDEIMLFHNNLEMLLYLI